MSKKTSKKKEFIKDNAGKKIYFNFNDSEYGLAFRTTIEEIIRENEFSRLSQIHEQLKNRGIEISEFKLRRYLKENNINKGFNNQGFKVYQIQWSPGIPTFNTRIKELVISMRNNENLIFIKTVSGAAPFVAKIIDGLSEQIGIMGTIAGDDAVLIIPQTTENLSIIYENLAKEIGNS